MTEPLPPYDEPSEVAVLGAMLLAADILDEVLTTLTADDFYVPAHRFIFTAIETLHSEGSKVDPVLVAEELDRLDLLADIGGPGVLIDLQAGCPATSNASSYAGIVVQRSNARRLIGECDAAIDAAYDLKDPEEVRDRLESALSSITTPQSEAVKAVSIDEFMRNYQESDRDESWIVDGLLKEQWRCVIVAAEGGGKAIQVDTPVLTVGGWKRLGDVVAGDKVYDLRGDVCNVTAAHDAYEVSEALTVAFSDGTELIADEQHKWLTHDYRQRQRQTGSCRTWPMSVRSTGEIADTLQAGDGHTANHSIPVNGPLEGTTEDPDMDPYLLGYWLGDGAAASSLVFTADEEVLVELRSRGLTVTESSDPYGYRVSYREHLKPPLNHTNFQSHLRSWGLLNNKHMPPRVLTASIAYRTEVFQGFIDADGYVTQDNVEICQTKQELADGFRELAIGLGCRVTTVRKMAKIGGRPVGYTNRMSFVAPFCPAIMPRKAMKWQPPRTQRGLMRYVKDVVKAGRQTVRCLTVDSPDRSWLVGENLVATHNTTMMRQFALAAAQGVNPFTLNPLDVGKVPTLIVDCENPDDSIYEVCQPITARLERWFETGRSLGEYEEGSAWLYHKPEGINLRSRVDLAKLDAVISSVKPKLVVAGPLYKMYDEASGDGVHTAMRATLRALDKLRTRHGFALMLEHHAPHGHAGSREMRPEGSSLLLRWPELGIGMTPHKDRGQQSKTHVKLTRWRNDRSRNSWPLWIRRELEMSDDHMPWRASQEPRRNDDFEGAFDEDYR